MSDGYIDLVNGETCISLRDMRNILVFKKSDASYHQGRELTKNERVLADQIAALRYSLRAAAAERDELQRTVEAQSAQLEQVRAVIESGSRIYLGSRNSISEYSERCQDWLAANAPAPEEERTICQCVCECDQVATKEDEHGTKLCEQCYNDYYGIAPQVTA